MTSQPPLHLTAHVRAMLAERGLDTEWVLRTLRSPLRIEPDRSRPGVWLAFGRVPEADDRILRVVYTDAENERRVITAFFDRRARRRVKEQEP
jgi:Domain of unknown function (DUF4258)